MAHVIDASDGESFRLGLHETVSLASLQCTSTSPSYKRKTSLAAMAKSKPMAKKLAGLRQREHERQVRITAEVDEWFRKFDTNGDHKLQRDELCELLTWLHPSRPPTDANLDLIIEKATAIETYSMKIAGDPNGSLSWHDVRPAVLQYNDYVKDQQYIDTVFERYDTDHSGELDASELLHLLQRIAPAHLQVDESDVEYILQHFDSNSDSVIDRNELLPLLAKWSHIAFDKNERAAREHAKKLSPAAATLKASGRRVLLTAGLRTATKTDVTAEDENAAPKRMSPAAAARLRVGGRRVLLTAGRVRMAASEPTGKMELPLQHSRSESLSRGSVAARDRDRAWQASDRVVAKKMWAKVQQETTRLLQLQEESGAGTILATEPTATVMADNASSSSPSSTVKASSPSSSKGRSRREGNDDFVDPKSSMCVIL